MDVFCHLRLTCTRRHRRHSLRRTFVSRLAVANVNVAVAQKLAGHAWITTTVKYYTGVMPEALKAAQAKLSFGEAIRDTSNPYHRQEGAAEMEAAPIVSPSSAAS